MIDGVPGIRHDGDVAGVEHRRREVGDALFRAEQRVQLRERIERQPETPLQVRRGRLPERRQADLERIAAHRRVLDRLGQRRDGHARRREVRVARADVDQVDALLDQPALDRGQLGHRVPRQRRESLGELGHVSPLRCPSTPSLYAALFTFSLLESTPCP